MMPSPALPVPSPAPSAPSASGPPANGGDAAGSVNFDALLTLLAGTGPTTVSAPTPGRPPAPARPAASARSAGSDKDADGPPTGTAPAPGSLEALVAALAQQLCGGSPAVIPPDPPSGGEAAVGQPAGPPPAVAQAVAPAVTPHPVPDAAGVPITAAGSPATEPILSTTGPVPPPTGPVPSPKPSPAADSSAAGRSPVAALADRRATAAPAAHDDAVLPDPAVRAPVEDAGPLGSGPHEPAPEPARRPSGPAGVEPQVSVPASAGPAPAGPAGAAEAPAASSGPAPAAAPVAVADQIVSAVVPLHGRGGGRHEVTLELRPESLGAIRVELSVEHETVHLTLHAAEPATAALLDRSLPDLRSALSDAGLHAGHIGVGPGGGNGAGQRRNPDDEAPTRPARDGRRTGPVPVPAVSGVGSRSATAYGAGRLDLLL